MAAGVGLDFWLAGLALGTIPNKSFKDSKFVEIC